MPLPHDHAVFMLMTRTGISLYSSILYSVFGIPCLPVCPWQLVDAWTMNGSLAITRVKRLRTKWILFRVGSAWVGGPQLHSYSPLSSVRSINYILSFTQCIKWIHALSYFQSVINCDLPTNPSCELSVVSWELWVQLQFNVHCSMFNVHDRRGSKFSGSTRSVQWIARAKRRWGKEIQSINRPSEYCHQLCDSQRLAHCGQYTVH